MLAMEPAEGSGGLWNDMLPDEPMPKKRMRRTDGATTPASEPVHDEPTQEPGESGDDGETGDGSASPTTGRGDEERLEPPAARLIIYTGAFEVFVLDIEGGIETAVERAQGLGGWMKASTSDSITLRIPVAEFEGFVEWIESDLGRVTSRQVQGTDVTEEYYDLEIRLQNALALRTRYQELLTRSETVEDTLKIEAELARVTGEIEQIKGRLRFLTQHSSFSTVTISFYREAERLPKNQGPGLPFRWLRTYRIDRVYQR